MVVTLTTGSIQRPGDNPQKPMAARSFRPELQGLRTIAVMAVVIYHLWPGRLTGGFVGVDVFFVISGYLITSHIYREVERTSRISLLGFWARRIRRLLPAAFMVLLVSLAACYIWLPETLWESTARQTASSALYFQNWILAADSVDYSATNADATVAQHYWSLSVEEQFYVFWPILIIVLLAIVRATAKRRPDFNPSARMTLIVGLAVVGLLSLVYSLYETAVNPAAAYFVTPTRVWEFSAGSLVALIFIDRRVKGRLGAVLVWVGLTAIISSSIAYSSTTPFPGYTALLPVAGTAAILASDGLASASKPGWFLSSKPMTFVGDISYAVYLWHWPLIVLAPWILQNEPGLTAKVGILALSIVLAWLTKVLLEEPLRKGGLLRRNGVVYSFAAVGMILVTTLSFGLVAQTNESSALSPAEAASQCHGPGALEPKNHCESVVGDAPPVPSAVQVSKENTSPRFAGCQAEAAGVKLVSCNLGVDAANATATVAIVGDSHATAWFAAVDAIGKKHGWIVITYTKSSCPVTAALRIQAGEKNSQNQADCQSWVELLNKEISSNKQISTVFTASFSSAYSFASVDGNPLANPAVEGFTHVWEKWLSAGKNVVVFDDVPRTNGQYVPTCLASHADNPLACAVTVAQALPKNMNITAAAKEMAEHGVTRISLADQFCDAKLCYPLVGRTIVYRDYSHLSTEYALALVPYIESQLKQPGE